MPASQAGRRGFESYLLLHLLNNLERSESHALLRLLRFLLNASGTGGARIEGVYDRKKNETPVVYAYEGTDDKHYDQEAWTFVKSVLGEGVGEDKYRNDAKYGVESTFMAILGREAAYRRESIGWDELWDSNKRLTFKG